MTPTVNRKPQPLEWMLNTVSDHDYLSYDHRRVINAYLRNNRVEIARTVEIPARLSGIVTRSQWLLLRIERLTRVYDQRVKSDLGYSALRPIAERVYTLYRDYQFTRVVANTATDYVYNDRIMERLTLWYKRLRASNGVYWVTVPSGDGSRVRYGDLYRDLESALQEMDDPDLIDVYDVRYGDRYDRNPPDGFIPPEYV